MITSWVQQLGWTKPVSGPENAAARPAVVETPQAASVAQTAPQTIAPKAPLAPSVDPEQVQQITRSLAALRQTVEQIAAAQDQIAREIKQVLAANVELLSKIPAPPPQPPAAPTPRPCRRHRRRRHGHQHRSNASPVNLGSHCPGRILTTFDLWILRRIFKGGLQNLKRKLNSNDSSLNRGNRRNAAPLFCFYRCF